MKETTRKERIKRVLKRMIKRVVNDKKVSVDRYADYIINT